MEVVVYQADLIFDGKGGAIQNGHLYTSLEGEVMALKDNDVIPDGLRVSERKVFGGILCPCFINSHCHLELSHMKGLIAPKLGLPRFIVELQEKRVAEKDQIFDSMTNAIEECRINGIVAVGDISNDAFEIGLKYNSTLRFYNFIESFGIDPGGAKKFFANTLDIYKQYMQFFPETTSIVPHAPYSLSDNLFHLIRDFHSHDKQIISMHNQETSSENEMFQKGSGPLFSALVELGADLSDFQIPSKTSLATVIDKLPMKNALILVHNTYTTLEDIELAEKRPGTVAWCFCPNANLYIENKLPDFNLFHKKAGTKLIGTDSLASNDELNILSEIKTISENSDVPLYEIISWACNNAAICFNWNNLGSFESGKRPGINWIEYADTDSMKLTERSKVQRIL